MTPVLGTGGMEFVLEMPNARLCVDLATSRLDLDLLAVRLPFDVVHSGRGALPGFRPLASVEGAQVTGEVSPLWQRRLAERARAIAGVLRSGAWIGGSGIHWWGAQSRWTEGLAQAVPLVIGWTTGTESRIEPSWWPDRTASGTVFSDRAARVRAAVWICGYAGHLPSDELVARSEPLGEVRAAFSEALLCLASPSDFEAVLAWLVRETEVSRLVVDRVRRIASWPVSRQLLFVPHIGKMAPAVREHLCEAIHGACRGRFDPEAIAPEEQVRAMEALGTLQLRREVRMLLAKRVVRLGWTAMDDELTAWLDATPPERRAGAVASLASELPLAHRLAWLVRLLHAAGWELATPVLEQTVEALDDEEQWVRWEPDLRRGLSGHGRGAPLYLIKQIYQRVHALQLLDGQTRLAWLQVLYGADPQGLEAFLLARLHDPIEAADAEVYIEALGLYGTSACVPYLKSLTGIFSGSRLREPARMALEQLRARMAPDGALTVSWSLGGLSSPDED